MRSADYQKQDIHQLAEFLRIPLPNLDTLSMEEQNVLLHQLVALMQLKLTRMSVSGMRG